MQKAADASVVWLNSDAQIASFHYEDGYNKLYPAEWTPIV